MRGCQHEREDRTTRHHSQVSVDSHEAVPVEVYRVVRATM